MLAHADHRRPEVAVPAIVAAVFPRFAAVLARLAAVLPTLAPLLAPTLTATVVATGKPRSAEWTRPQ
jgi:hypothetical protein